jgi:hypothetical protein
MRPGEGQEIGHWRARAALLVLALLGLPGCAAPRPDDVVPAAAAPESRCATRPAGSQELLAAHAHARSAAPPVNGPAPDDFDDDHVALLHDRGDLVIRRNPFDLHGQGVRFAPNLSGGYDPLRLPLDLGPPGAPLDVPSAGAAPVALPFAFPFYGRSHGRVFLQGDGSLTFERADAGDGEPGLHRFLSGPPRVAAYFAALDPSRGGRVTGRLEADRAVFQWSGVPGSGQINRNTFEVTIHASGAVEVAFGSELQTGEALVGLSPGGGAALVAARLSESEPAGTRGAILERFSEVEKLDLVMVARRFYAAHADAFDQLVVYTTRSLNPLPGSLAFEVNVRNEVQGIGLDLFDHSAAWGSAGELRSIAYMDAVDPYLEVDGFEILAHEVGHRWLSRVRFRRGVEAPSGALLGRGGVHWSFFLDSDASVLEGNRIRDRGNGRFETVEIAEGYSALDQYVMGLRHPAEVAPFFYVDEADDFRPNRAFRFSSAPEAGVSFTGVRRDVTIGDVIAALGPRVPDADQAPRVLRQAYLLVAEDASPATPARRAAVARIRERFGPYYREATQGRGAATTVLR